jgi:hypothetical protein
MKRQVSVLLPILTAAMIVGCVGAPPPSPAQVAVYENDGVICREMLVTGSNQLRRVCGTTEQWDRYDRRQAAVAQALVMRMQGSAYSGE